MKIEENGKTYTVDEQTGLVVEAAEAEQDLTDEFRLGHRVEVAGKLGEIISVIPSVYGVAFGVQFDDGEIDEFAEGNLKRTAAEKTASYDSPIEELFARYNHYYDSRALTDSQIENKEAEARWLNLNASSLRSAMAANGSSRDEKLDEIILITQTDLRDLKEIRESVDSESSKTYLSSQNSYKLAEDIMPSSPNFGQSQTGDASWLDVAYDGMEVAETTDADLAARAIEVVAALSKEQLENQEFMKLVASFQEEYLKTTDGREQRFSSYLEEARKERLKELDLDSSKTASTESRDLTDIDPSAIYM